MWGRRGKRPGSSDVGLLLEMAPLIWLSLLSKQILKFEAFSLYKFFLLLWQCIAKLYAKRTLLNGTCIAKIVSLV